MFYQPFSRHQQRRHLKVWHDHSDILNGTNFSIMISCIYDRAFYLTNQEYKAKYPDRKPVHVQSLVEKRKMYVFGQSKSTDIDQMSYTPTRFFFRLERGLMFEAEKCFHIVPSLKMSSLSAKLLWSFTWIPQRQL
jgi:hypothetical protein